MILLLSSCISPKKIPQSSPTSQSKKSSKTKSNTSYAFAYIEKFASVSVSEMKAHRIPASITLAQGILESASGRSRLARKANNHFGIKCHSNWKGERISHDDNSVAECFRKYDNPEQSYKDHSFFLTSKKRYSSLFRLKTTDYKGWAYGLRRAGYATDSRYPQKLIAIIERYNLSRFDKNFTKITDKPVLNQLIHIVKKGDTMYALSKKYGVSVESIKRANNLSTTSLSIGQKLVIKK